ncbi:hypothetical protein [Kosmotoga pacifica]|uniref:Uncharacterized protein n=1 Tax=Kosmotoga pacifica TaxID=1330330 RepID=A0A0G2ZAQ9_9BACT|nr:hypothetical protein [Kosmotoga pacifica]AKI97181.1 hypothetical protein IX53_04440 [Kosmotoga pacifica]
MKRALLSIFIVLLVVMAFGKFSLGLNSLIYKVSYDADFSSDIIITPDLSETLYVLGSLDLRVSISMFHLGAAVPLFGFAKNLTTGDSTFVPMPGLILYAYGGAHLLLNKFYIFADVGAVVLGPFGPYIGNPLLRLGGGMMLGKHGFVEIGFLKWLVPVEVSQKNVDIEFGYVF